MTLIEAAKQAREAFEWNFNTDLDNIPACERWAKMLKENIAALNQAIAEAEQQPEPCVHAKNPKGCYRVRCQLGNKCVDDDMAFRTSPQRGEAEAPKRQAEGAAWQGLTDEEIKEIVGPWGETPIKGYTRKLFDQIEAKLKEKNT